MAAVQREVHSGGGQDGNLLSCISPPFPRRGPHLSIADADRRQTAGLPSSGARDFCISLFLSELSYLAKRALGVSLVAETLILITSTV
jgi:hypothetical protein